MQRQRALRRSPFLCKEWHQRSLKLPKRLQQPQQHCGSCRKTRHCTCVRLGLRAGRALLGPLAAASTGFYWKILMRMHAGSGAALMVSMAPLTPKRVCTPCPPCARAAWSHSWACSVPWACSPGPLGAAGPALNATGALQLQRGLAGQPAHARMPGLSSGAGRSAEGRTAVAPLPRSRPSCSAMKRVGALLVRFGRGCSAGAAASSAGTSACCETCTMV